MFYKMQMCMPENGKTCEFNTKRPMANRLNPFYLFVVFQLLM